MNLFQMHNQHLRQHLKQVYGHKYSFKSKNGATTVSTIKPLNGPFG